jgi:hypothetical protein
VLLVAHLSLIRVALLVLRVVQILALAVVAVQVRRVGTTVVLAVRVL